MKTKSVPYKWYKENCGELLREYYNAKMMPSRQQKRIDDVIESGLDYEVMKGGNGHSWEISLIKLNTFLEDALKVDVSQKLENYKAFKAKHKGVKGLEGFLQPAKNEAELKKHKNPNFIDKKYDFYWKLVNKHYLSNAQSLLLMDYLIKIEVL